MAWTSTLLAPANVVVKEKLERSHAHLDTLTCAYALVHTYTKMNIHAGIHIHARTHARTHVHTKYIHLYSARKRIHTFWQASIHVHAYLHAYTYTRIYRNPAKMSISLMLCCLTCLVNSCHRTMPHWGRVMESFYTCPGADAQVQRGSLITSCDAEGGGSTLGPPAHGEPPDSPPNGHFLN